MKAKGLEKIDIPDGSYRARMGGKTVVIRRFEKAIRFEVDGDVGDVSIGVYVTVKDGYATVNSNNHY